MGKAPEGRSVLEQGALGKGEVLEEAWKEGAEGGWGLNLCASPGLPAVNHPKGPRWEGEEAHV